MVSIKENKVILLDNKYECFVDGNGEVFNVAYFRGSLIDSYLEGINFFITFDKSGHLMFGLPEKNSKYFTKSRLAKYLYDGLKLVNKMIKHNEFYNPISYENKLKIVKSKRIKAIKKFGKKVKSL